MPDQINNLEKDIYSWLMDICNKPLEFMIDSKFKFDSINPKNKLTK